MSYQNEVFLLPPREVSQEHLGCIGRNEVYVDIGRLHSSLFLPTNSLVSPSTHGSEAGGGGGGILFERH